MIPSMLQVSVDSSAELAVLRVLHDAGERAASQEPSRIIVEVCQRYSGCWTSDILPA